MNLKKVTETTNNTFLKNWRVKRDKKKLESKSEFSHIYTD